MSDTPRPVTIIGGGLAGSEAALQLAARGIPCELWEQRPTRNTPAHTGENLAELVCSNSLKSTDPVRAQGLLKAELRELGCRLLAIAEANQVPGGAALCVDREAFSTAVTAEVEDHPLVTLRRGEYTGLREAVADEERITVIATGPMTSDGLWSEIQALLGTDGAYFYDATSPVFNAGSVDMEVAFAQSRYGKGGSEDYINCPFEREDYEAFREALISAEQYPLSPGDDYKLFEGCLPVEELAQRGRDTMRFGPLKPKGLTDPRTGRMPWAVVQLRWEDALRSSVSLVGFQTRLRQGEQERVFRMIPGLEQAVFTRFGRMHRNNYLNAPKLLQPTLQLIDHPQVFVAGQLTGLEGYNAAITTGFWAGLNAARLSRGLEPVVPHEHSCAGAMVRFMTNLGHKHYLPTAFQFGMLAWLPEKIKRQHKQKMIIDSCREAWVKMRSWLVE